MTPTGLALDELEPGSLARLDPHGRHVEGEPPTKEIDLHLAVYAVRPEAVAVIHLHSTWAVALACRDDLDPNEPLAPLTPYQVMRVYPLLVVPYARPGSKELAELVRSRTVEAAALLLANHGSLVRGTSLAGAAYAAEELEEAAKLRFALDGRPVRRLNPDAVEDIERNLLR